MTEKEIESSIQRALDVAYLHVEGDGYHFTATIVSQAFEGLRSVKRQQKVYAAVKEAIASGALHALSLKTYTPSEWETIKDK